MKLRFGEMAGRLSLTSWYADCIDRPKYDMRYAMVRVTERDTPAMQWMRMIEFVLQAFSARDERDEVGVKGEGEAGVKGEGEMGVKGEVGIEYKYTS